MYIESYDDTSSELENYSSFLIPLLKKNDV